MLSLGACASKISLPACGVGRVIAGPQMPSAAPVQGWGVTAGACGISPTVTGGSHMKSAVVCGWRGGGTCVEYLGALRGDWRDVGLSMPLANPPSLDS